MEKELYRFIFKVRFENQADLNAYVRIWKQGSQIIQDESEGAEGTMLHVLDGEDFTVLAIATWHSKVERDDAFKILSLKYGPDHVVHSNGAGEVTVIGHALKIAEVWPMVPKA